jgi:hypothetical protein
VDSEEAGVADFAGVGACVAFADEADEAAASAVPLSLRLLLESKALHD